MAGSRNASKSASAPSKTKAKTDKRKVVMRSLGMAPNGDPLNFEAVDYVPEGILDVYVADAQTRWQSVVVEDGYDAGPGGVDGETADLPHLAGKTATDFAKYGDATTPENALDEHLAAVAHAASLADNPVAPTED